MTPLKETKRRAGSALRKISTFLTASASVCGLLLLILIPHEGLAGARDGLTLCADVVIPSLFPFLALCAFVINTGLAEKAGRIFERLTQSLFRLPGCAAPVLALGLLGGYPVGAKAVAALKNKGALTKSEGDRLLCFCINSSPAFIIGAVGSGMLRSANAGMLLYAAHIAASLMLGLIMGLFVGREKIKKARLREPVRGLPVSESFVRAVTDSATSMLYICAFVVLFSCLTRLFTAVGLFGNLAGFIQNILPSPASGASFYERTLIGLMEVTNGCAGAAALRGLPAILLISGLLSFSSISVQFQVMAAIGGSGLSAKKFVMTRVLHILFSVLITLLLFSLFPVAIPTFAAEVTPSAAIHSAPASTALLLLCALLLMAVVKV